MNAYRQCVFALCLTGMILAWSGCGSLVPIGDSTEAVPVPELVGTWQIVEDTDERPDHVAVFNFNDTEYYVELQERKLDPSRADTLRLRVYITSVDGKRFINAQHIDSVKPDERVFFFYAYDLSPEGVLTLTELQDVGDQQIDKFETSEALHGFIRENVHNEALYGTSTRLVRVNVTG